MHKFMGGGRSYAGRWGFAGVSGGLRWVGGGTCKCSQGPVSGGSINRFRLFADY